MLQALTTYREAHDKGGRLAVAPASTIEKACDAHLRFHNASSSAAFASAPSPLDEYLGKGLREAACGRGVCRFGRDGRNDGLNNAVWCAESYLQSCALAASEVELKSFKQAMGSR